MVSLRYEVKIIDLLEKHTTERLAGIRSQICCSGRRYQM
jgi:hypothetical protein